MQDDQLITGPEVGAEGSTETGTARARRVLIDPLSGLARPRGVAEAAHREALAWLSRKLSYMDAATLAGLCELVLGHAGKVAVGKHSPPACPPDAMILAWGYALQPPPIQQSDYPASVLRSVMGRRAHDAGFGVELLRHARRFGPPPAAYSMVQLRDEADGNRRRRSALRVEIAAGNSLSPDQTRWMDAYYADAEIVARLIAEGDARREASAGAEAA
jgi:hypothetical protein